MHIQEIGSKNAPSIVFLHGGGMSSWIWKKQIEHFKDYHCLVPDLPGHGKSNEPKAIPRAKGVLVRAVNHTFPWTEADLFNKIIRQWITDIPLESKLIYEV